MPNKIARHFASVWGSRLTASRRIGSRQRSTVTSRQQSGPHAGGEVCDILGPGGPELSHSSSFNGRARNSIERIHFLAPRVLVA